MGTLANSELRNRRILAHRALSKMWEGGIMTKEQTYIWLQCKLGLEKDQTHIGMFGEYMCDRVIAECNEVYKRFRTIA